MSIPDFSAVPLPHRAPHHDRAAWEAAVAGSTGSRPDKLAWQTPEGIDVAPLYSAADLEGLGEEVRERVLAHSGISLVWEIMRVGEPAPEAE